MTHLGTVNKAGQTSLSLAYSNRHLEMVKYLVQEQLCNPNCMLCLIAFYQCDRFDFAHSVVVNKVGDTPLYLECSYGTLDWVKALINEHINPNSK